MSILKTKRLYVEQISKTYDKNLVIKNVSLYVNAGEIVALVGASGVGKTTIFNIIAGLLLPERGEVYLDGKKITGEVGKVGYMLQKDLLLPHKKVLDNVVLPLLIRGEVKKMAYEKARELFPLFGLSGYESKYPAQLSGGMRQRAALLRTYFLSKDVVLLDEPFSAMDAMTREKMYEWYLGVAKKLQLSTIFITHDLREAKVLASRVYTLAGSPGTISN